MRLIVKASLKAKELLYSYYWLVPALLLGHFIIKFSGNFTNSSFDSSLVFLGGVFSFTFFLQKQKLDELDFFRKSFAEFNKKYDKLNNFLRPVLLNNEVTLKSIPYVIDYFNLCAEEYMLYKRGYIPIDVWESWLAGMRQYWEIPSVQILWKEELKTCSYYGFNPEYEFEVLRFYKKCPVINVA